MNTNQENAKNGIIKTLAIIGLIAIIIGLIWGGVQLVRALPSAFSSLASVADTVYNNRPIDTLSIATEKNIVNSGESFKVSWTDLEREGEYSFYYTCTEGVSVELRTGDGNTSPVRCGSPVLLPEGRTSLDMIIDSERRRFIDVPFTVAFTPTDENEALFERNTKVTIVNATIPQSEDLALENGEMSEDDTDTDTEPEDTANGTQTPSPTPAPTPTQTQQTYTYIPQSDENGFTDLAVAYLGVGILDGNDFEPAASLDVDERGAIQFEVKNVGTKTSEDWAFEAELPNGSTYASEEQTGLRPNERAVYTIGFSITEEGVEEMRVEIDVPDEQNSSNNAFEWAVRVTD